MNKQQIYYQKNKEIVKQRVKDARLKAKLDVSPVEFNLIIEYKRMLEFQTTHSSYMIWITKINLVHNELKIKRPKRHFVKRTKRVET